VVDLEALEMVDDDINSMRMKSTCACKPVVGRMDIVL
jgi:hypothetical protein